MAVALAASLAGACGSSPAKDRDRRIFDDLLDTAKLRSGDDALLKHFAIEARIPLDHAIKSFNRLAVAPDGTLLVLDFDGPAATSFSRDGRRLAAIGKAGADASAYLRPSGIASLTDGAVAVAQFKPSRVIVYDSTGAYKTSFVYSPQHFAALNVTADPAGRDVYLFGLRRDAGGGERTLVHRYAAADGRFLGSQFPFPDVPTLPGSEKSFEPIFSWTRQGSLVVALPFHYRIFEMDAAGAVSTVIDGGAFRGFRVPTRPLDLSAGPELGALTFRDWRVHWTPIDAVGTVADKVLVQRQTFDPLRYTIDVWTRGGRQPLLSIKTNLALLAVDQAGVCYFRENPDHRHQPGYVILKARLIDA